MANLGLPLADIRGTYFSSWSNNVITGTWPAPQTPAIFQPQTVVIGANNSNPYNWLAFDNYTSDYDASWDGRGFSLTTRVGAPSIGVVDQTQLLCYSLNPPIAGIYSLSVEVVLGTHTIILPTAGQTYHVDTFMTAGKNYSQFFNYSQTQGNAGPPGCYTVGGQVVDERVCGPAGFGAPAGAPAYGPNGAECISFGKFTSYYDSTNTPIVNPANSSCTLSCLAPFDGTGDNVQIVIYMVVSNTSGGGNIPAVTRPVVSSTVQMVKVADSVLANGATAGLQAFGSPQFISYNGTNLR